VTRGWGEHVGVVGAGVVGLAVARELGRGGRRVTVFDKEDRVGAHQSGHNSGVVHAGLYYPPGSLKATLCRRGGDLLREFCAGQGIPVVDLGKLVVATSIDEVDRLDDIERRARANQVPSLTRLDAAGAREIEPRVNAVAALHSPRTAVVDYVAVCAALAREVADAGNAVELGRPVTGIREHGDHVVVEAGETTHRFDSLVVCAGLTGDAVARMLGAAADLRIVPFRGEYYELRPAVRELVRGLIYPVPDPEYPFLGVHLTRDVRGGVHVGPNAVLALALEGYRWRDVSARDLGRLAAWPGLRKVARQHWRNGLREMRNSVSTRRFTAEVRRYLPDLTSSDLVRSAAGVRAQAVDRGGRLLDDFVLQRSGRVLLVRNAPSPAATASLAIAEHIVAAVA
jgi:L-2-hydroxyglutarate oxidase LhgO